MLVPRRVLARLRRQLQGVPGIRLRPAQQHTAAGSGNDLVAVERQPAEFTERAALLAVVCRTQRLGSVLDQGNAVLTADGSDLVQLGGVAVQMHCDDRFGRAVQLERAAKRGGIHVPRLTLRVDKYRLCTAICHGIGRRGEGQALTEHRIAGLYAREDHRQMQRRRPGGQRDGIAPAHVCAHGFFKFVHVLAQRRDPVFPECVVDIFQFIALVRHMRTGQQKTFIHALSYPFLHCIPMPNARTARTFLIKMFEI